MMRAVKALSRTCAALAVSATISMVGCSANVTYTPTASMSQQEAMAVISRCLEEQPGSYAAMDVNVSSEKLTYVTGGGRFLRGGGLRGTAFYFDSLGEMDITPKRKGNVVRVWDSSGVLRLVVVIPDLGRAKQFTDAMASMSKSGGAASVVAPPR